MLLFVYGTLMEKYVKASASSMLKELGAKKIGEATIKGTIYEIGWFPGLKLDGDELVHGEIWEVDDSKLKYLDAYEGCHNNNPDTSLYIREEVEARVYDKTAPDTVMNAIAYTYVPSIEGREKVEGGDYFFFKKGE